MSGECHFPNVSCSQKGRGQRNEAKVTGQWRDLKFHLIWLHIALVCFHTSSRLTTSLVPDSLLSMITWFSGKVKTTKETHRDPHSPHTHTRAHLFLHIYVDVDVEQITHITHGFQRNTTF